jgi:hypothetical protein
MPDEASCVGLDHSCVPSSFQTVYVLEPAIPISGRPSPS